MAFIISNTLIDIPAKITVDPDGMHIIKQAWLPCVLSIPTLGILINLGLKRYKTALAWLLSSVAIFVIPFAAIGFGHQLKKVFEASDNETTATPTSTKTSSPKPTPNTNNSSNSLSNSSNSVDYNTILTVAVSFAAVILLVGLAYLIKDYVSGKRAIIAANNQAKLEEKKKQIELDKELTTDWNNLIIEHQNILDKWNIYDKSIKDLLELPAMRDFSIPEIGAVIDALDAAEDAKSLRYPVGIQSVNNTNYYKMVKNCDRVFDNALKVAINYKNKVMTSDERKKLALANQLLKTAMDNSASVNERQLAYSRVVSIMEDLRIDVPEKIVVEIENSTRKLLEA